jgi:HD-like signal output (HDOD) protein
MAGEDGTHFRILEDIARDLSGDVNFPTCLDAAILVRNTLNNPAVGLDRAVQVIGNEPLIASKLLRLANSVSHNPYGETISNLSAAIGRLGFDIVRTTALAVSMDQMRRSRHLVAYDRISRQTWAHSVEVAAIARNLARHVGGIPPDAAMLAGLVQHIGIFYLMYRAAEYPDYRHDELAMIELLSGWHEGVGESLLHILGLPQAITDAVRDQSQRAPTAAPATIGDVLHLATQLADSPMDWLPGPLLAADALMTEAERASYTDILAEAQHDIVDLQGALAN